MNMASPLTPRVEEDDFPLDKDFRKPTIEVSINIDSKLRKAN